ncbi:MAG: FAD-binding protein [Bacteroidales bacterium]|nr:FAD-binding protein [Bacteroidales bacterium]
MTRLEFTSDLMHPLGPVEIDLRVKKQLARSDIRTVLVKRSVDCRRTPTYRYQVDVYLPGEEVCRCEVPKYGDVADACSVIVVGAGPAGMFASLKLLSLGLKPVVLERGRDVHSRKFDVAALSRSGAVDPDSNYCFGEGGAGTFSDGKLFTRSSKRGDNREVLCQLVAFGADESILYDAHPHIGSDKLPVVVENIRKCIVAHGGEYHFQSRVDALEKCPEGWRVHCSDGKSYVSGAVVLATGHSARDIYEMLLSEGGSLEQKGFALGVRCEHPQSIINRAQYSGAWREGVPAAEYSFVRQVGGRGVFSFCMCPGGILVPSSTQAGTVVLNGMSNSARNSKWANAGVVVQIEPGDVSCAKSPLGLMDFQRDVERRCYDMGARLHPGMHPLCAPAQRMVDFCKGRMSSSLPDTSYHPGTYSCNLADVLPEVVASSLRQAFPGVPVPGYYTNEALLLGVESRTSSPVRIPRNPQTLEYVSMPGVFPCGEGAGYSGGIVSSAIDGIRCAQAAYDKLKNQI